MTRPITTSATHRSTHRRLALIAAALSVLVATVAPALEIRALAAPEPAAGKTVPLPYNVVDATGNTWMVYGNGMIQQQGGNAPVFSQLGQITVSGTNIPMMRGNQQARLDEKSGDIILENLPAGQVRLSRRVNIKQDDGTVRYLDTFTNPTNRELTVAPQYTNNINFGVQTHRIVTDPKRKEAQLGWAAFTHGGKAAYMVWGFAGGKVSPRINYPEGSNLLQVSYSLTIPASGSVSVVHTHGTADSLDRAADNITAVRLPTLLKGVDRALLKSLANAPQKPGNTDDLELLRGDTTDIIETRSGDTLRGTLTDATFPLKTAFGRVELPAAQVIAFLSAGKQRPLQLIVTTEGEVYGGVPERDFLTLQLSSGQAVKVPTSQVIRAGFRKRDNEPDELALTKPTLLLRTGERMAIATPAGPLNFASRYGLLKLPPASVASITLKADDTPAHIVTLTDGSRFSGIFFTEGNLDLTLDGAAGKVPLSVPVSAIARIKPSSTPAPNPDASPEDDKATPELTCTGDDVFCGSLDGTFQIDTPFEAIDIRGDQVRRIVRADLTSSDIQITLWDGTTLTGQPRQPTLAIKLAGGMVVGIPIDLLQSYVNPLPRASDETANRVKALVAKLNDDDFKARESAQQALIAAGAPIVPLLKELRATQPPEGQQRIDQILSQLDK